MIYKTKVYRVNTIHLLRSEEFKLKKRQKLKIIIIIILENFGPKPL